MFPRPSSRTIWVQVALVGGLTIATLAPLGTVSGSQSDAIRATLDGRPVATGDLWRYHCHDLAFPEVRCFSSASARDADAMAIQNAVVATSVAYVQWWDNAYPTSSDGSWVASQPYSDLRTIGWNDRISAFTALNGRSGRFAEHIGITGRLYPFCCNTPVSYVGNDWNDVFSSVEPTS